MSLRSGAFQYSARLLYRPTASHQVAGTGGTQPTAKSATPLIFMPAILTAGAKMIRFLSQSVPTSEPSVRNCATQAGRLANSAAVMVWIVLSGAVMAANLASSNHPWWAWLSPLPLFLVIRYWRPLAVLFFGALWGGSIYGFSTLVFDQAPFVPGLRSLLFLSVIPAIYGCFGSWVSVRMGFSTLFLAVGWIAVELALIPLGMRTGLLAGAYEEGTLLAIMEGVLGYAFVAFTIAWINGLLVCLLGRVIRLADAGSRYRPRSADGQKRLFVSEAIVDLLQGRGAVQARGPPQRSSSPT